MCKSPLYGYRYRQLNLDGFHKGLLVNEIIDDSVYGELRVSEKKFHFCKSYDEWIHRQEIFPDDEYARIPCGQCIECRLRYSKEWACRIVCEQITSSSSLFVTLTYNDENLPLNSLGMSCLNYDHLKNFIKRLRESVFRATGERNLRYYAAGEYGSKYGRCHFHICFFNLPDYIINCRKFYKVSPLGDPYFFNPILESLWGFGYVVVGDLNYLSAAYVSRYVCKKLKGKSSSFYTENELVPEQPRMSLKPGIGKEFFDLHRDEIYKNDELFLPSVGKVMSSRYFDKLFELDSPEEMAIIKANRLSKSLNSFNDKLSRTDMNEVELLKSELDSLTARCKKLYRPLDNM